MVRSLLTTVRWFLKKVSTKLVYDPAIPLLNTDPPGNLGPVAEAPGRTVKQEDPSLACGPHVTSTDHRGSTALLDMPPAAGRKCSSLPPPPTFATHHHLPLAKREDSRQGSLGNRVCREGHRINLRPGTSDSKLFHLLNSIGLLLQGTVWLLPSFPEVSIQRSHKARLSPLYAEE